MDTHSSKSRITGSGLRIFGTILIAFTLFMGFISANSVAEGLMSPLLFWGGLVSGGVLIGLGIIIKLLSQILTILKREAPKE